MNFIHAHRKFPNFPKICTKQLKFYKFSFLKVVTSQEDQMGNLSLPLKILTHYSSPKLEVIPLVQSHFHSGTFCFPSTCTDSIREPGQEKA